MKRILFNDLLKWKNSPIRKPLLLRGARQVGKTHLIRQLGQTFHSFIEINFEKSPELAKLFEYDLDINRIVRELSIALNKDITPGKSLLFFDEIQDFPKILTSLRFFYEEMPELHVIAAGSLLDFAIEKVGVPVGRINFCYLYPLSFIEYLAARGAKKLALEIINHLPSHPLSVVLHNKAIKLLGEYMALGGMPEVIYRWITNQDIKICTHILQDIKNAYEQDFTKYAQKHQIKYVELLFNQIPRLICQHFKYAHLSTTYRKRELEPTLYLLEKAGIIHLIFQTAGNGLPLGAKADPNKIKLILHDVGLTQAILGLELKEWFIEPNLAIVNKGAIAESFVGQELLAYSNPDNKYQLYYWHREQRASNAEVDYLIAQDAKIIPLEVKSGHGGGLQSLRLFLQLYPNSAEGIRFSIHNYSVHDNIHSYPLYAVAGTIENKERLVEFLESDN